MTRRHLAETGAEYYDCPVKKCEICSAQATVFLTQIINGKSTRVALCAKCAKDKGVLDPSAFDLAEKLFSDVVQENESPQAGKAGAPLQPVSTRLPLTLCPTCGFTLDDYRRVGRFGCSRCYDVFAEEIRPVLEEIQGHDEHLGKRPEHADRRVKVQQDVFQLEEKLFSAIKREDYEAAAKLRDEIAMIRQNANA